VPPVYRGLSGYFAQFNRNKRSIVVDLKSSRGQVLARSLAQGVDVLIENFRPGVADRLGLGYDVLKQGNPGLIYASVNGYGDDGPYADQPAYDQVLQGLVGFMPIQGGAGSPAAIKNSLADKISAMSAAVATLAALNHRHVSGGGQRVNVRMLDAWAAFILQEQMRDHIFQVPEAPRAPPPADIFRTFATRDGHVIGLVIQDNQFFGICDALNRPELKADPRFAKPYVRLANSSDLHAELSPDIARLSTREFIAAVRRHEVPFAPVNDIQGFFRDEQVKHNRTYFDVEDPDFGMMRHLRFMATFGGTPSGLRRRAPTLGEHTDEVLHEFGHSSDAIADLRAAGIVR
jgi:crotonobetainyl-CoA:carnitine CoA-transferase CaiB-like acyl-CoA transferase